MRYLSRISAVLFLAACGAAHAQAPAAAPAAAARPAMHAVLMGLTSSGFEDGGIIPDKFTAKGATPGNPAPSPALSWTGAPAGTQSFALVMHDTDVVVGKSIVDNLHWLAFNIPGTATGLPQGVPTTPTLADGTVQVKRGTTNGYGGPGAPPGVYHHYIFEIYALDAKLTLGPDATRDDVMKAMDGHVLDRGTLVGRFHR